MSKPIKEMIRGELKKRFDGLSSMAVIGFSGLGGVATNEIRGRLLEKDIRVTVVKNSLARQAFKELGIEAAADMLDGPCAVAYGADSVVDVVRELLNIGKESPALTVKAALLEGQVFGPDRIDELSKFPTRDEALAKVVACVLSPAGKLSACLTAPGAKIAGILKTIEENQEADEPVEEAPAEEAPAEEAPAEEAPAEAPAEEAPAEEAPAEEAPAEEAPAEEAPAEEAPAEEAPAEEAPAEEAPAEAPEAPAAEEAPEAADAPEEPEADKDA
jgi:large subunit ribosomal protein L10